MQLKAACSVTHNNLGSPAAHVNDGSNLLLSLPRQPLRRSIYTSPSRYTSHEPTHVVRCSCVANNSSEISELYMANGCQEVLFTRGTGQVSSDAPLATSGNIVVNSFSPPADSLRGRAKKAKLQTYAKSAAKFRV